MAFSPKSIRWRFQIWLAFLLVAVLIGFGVSAHQLQVANQNHHIYEELQRHLSAVASDLTSGGRGPHGHHDRERDFPRHEDGTRSSFRNERRTSEHSAEDRPPVKDAERYTNGFDEVIKLSPPSSWRTPGSRGSGQDGPAIRISSEVQALFDQNDPNGFYFVIWNREGIERLRSTNAPAEVEMVGRVNRGSGPQLRAWGKYRESYLQHALGYRVLVGRSIAPELTHRRNYALWLLAAGAVILVVGLCGSWRLADRALRPVAAISTAATRISAGNLSERINVAETDDELGQLAATLNSTFARLEDSFAQQKQFTADASHELRTPLAVMISEAQTTLARERTAAEYRETVEACLDAAQQMRRLTESLLALARFDASQKEVQRQPIDLAKTVSSCVDLVHPLAEARGIKIQSDLRPVTALGDAALVHQVITNLLANGIHYNKPAGEIRIYTTVENGSAILTVTDTGIGIAPEDLPHIFKRFYRADKARGRADGRSGLGLAICTSIMDALGGSIEATSRPGAGTTFTLRLPVAPAGS